MNSVPPLNKIVPMLPVRSMPASVRFYQNLGFEVVKQVDAWGWARMTLNGCDLMLDQSIRHHTGMSPCGVLYLYPHNIREYHAVLKARGVPLPELEMTFYGMLEFRIEDPDGNRLWIGGEP